MFKAVMQTYKDALIKLVSDTLNMPEEDITSCEIVNSVHFGRDLMAKRVALDIKVLVNGNRIIDFEMQNYKDEFWSARTLVYVTRCFDNLKGGENYSELLPTQVIGFLNFTPFKNNEKFYSCYQFLDNFTYCEYTETEQGWVSLEVIDMKKRTLADSSEHEQKLAKWSELFMADSFEVVEAAAEGNEVFEQVVVTMRQLSADEEMRMCMEAQEEYERMLRGEREGGRREGLKKARQVYNMLKEGLAIEQISKATGLSESEVVSLSI